MRGQFQKPSNMVSHEQHKLEGQEIEKWIQITYIIIFNNWGLNNENK